jgi:hypothetical protein
MAEMDASNWWLIQTSLTPQRVALASAFVYFVVPRILSVS